MFFPVPPAEPNKSTPPADAIAPLAPLAPPVLAPAEDEDDRSDYGFRRRPDDVFEFTGEQRQLLGRIATWMTILGALMMLGAVAILVVGILAATSSNTFGAPVRDGSTAVSALIQGVLTLVLGLLTLIAGTGFRRAAWAHSSAGGFLTDALRSLNTLYAFSTVLVLLGIGLVAMVVCAGLGTRF